MPDKMKATIQTPSISPHNRAGESKSDPRRLEQGSDKSAPFAHIILGMD